MSVQYPKWTHTTLPSVEGAFGSLNILRDPPASRHTRFINKPTYTSQLVEQIDGSDGRTNECIKPFARGVNPSVNVDYNNSGTQGGQVRYQYGNADSNNTQMGTVQASLPYKVMDKGAFRPPTRTQEELLPLSRLPRLLTTQSTNPSTQQVLQQLQCTKPDMRAVRNQLLNVCVPSRASYIIETAAQKPYETAYAIQTNNLIGEVNTNLSQQRHTYLVNQEPSTGIVHNGRDFATMAVNPSKILGTNPADQIGNQPISVKDLLLAPHQTNLSSVLQQNNLHVYAPELVRNTPMASAYTNAVTASVDMSNTATDRNVYLPTRTARGSFDNCGTQPMMHANVRLPTLNNQKRQLFGMAAAMEANTRR